MAPTQITRRKYRRDGLRYPNTHTAHRKALIQNEVISSPTLRKCMLKVM
jgi:hypothetical protein